MSSMQAVIDRAQVDLRFRHRLRADPAAVFREAGVETPEGVTFEVVEITSGDIFLPLGARTGMADLDRILERAERDTSFEELLSKDPKSAIEAHIGRKLPPSCNVHVRASRSDTIYVCVPDPPDSVRELSEDELASVAGGASMVEYALLLFAVLIVAAVPVKTLK